MTLTRGRYLIVALLLLGLVANASAAVAEPVQKKAQTIVHMLDYISVDYPQFVRDGEVLDEAEYEEQLEFATQAVALLDELPSDAQRARLLVEAQGLRAMIAAKGDGAQVATLAGALYRDVIATYQLAVAPRLTPDLKRGAQLYASDCAACHGANGLGDGPAGAGLEPAPSNFHDHERMAARSVYGLYNTISLGVDGTSMRPFAELSEADRWALAFFVAGVGTSPAVQQQGSAAWQKGEGKSAFPDIGALVTTTPDQVRREHDALAVAVQAFLIAEPAALQANRPAPIDLARGTLRESLAAYRGGDAAAARRLAINAYLEGFELVEAGLDNVDRPLRLETEREMMALRSAIASGQPADMVAQQIERIDALLDRVESELEPGTLSPTTAFLSSLLILLREGLEAILVLAAIIALVVKTGRRDALRYIHIGWIAAVILGIITWFVANYLFAISGANREITEGITALVAAAMLLYVGYWLHSKSYAQAWQKFIRDQVGAALEKRTLWAMATVSFLAVYRELFEIVLFYEALWVQAGDAGRNGVLAGIAVAAVALAVIAWAILKYGIRLPIGPFFAATGGLLAILAVVFAGNGIAALQEAGVVDSSPLQFVSVPLLGVHPTAQGLAAQFAALVLVVLGVSLARRQARAHAVAAGK